MIYRPSLLVALPRLRLNAAVGHHALVVALALVIGVTLGAGHPLWGGMVAEAVVAGVGLLLWRSGHHIPATAYLGTAGVASLVVFGIWALTPGGM